jgi:hypothetical protein
VKDVVPADGEPSEPDPAPDGATGAPVAAAASWTACGADDACVWPAATASPAAAAVSEAAGKGRIGTISCVTATFEPSPACPASRV